MTSEDPGPDPGGTTMADYPFIREVHSPVGDDQLRPLDPRCRVVQFSEPLTDRDFAKLARFLSRYPEVPLRIYGHHRTAPDLDFLEHFPFLKGFQADVFGIESWDGLRHLPDTLEFLGLGATRRKLSLLPIARLTRLRDLALEGHRKDLEVVRGFERLVYLTLRSITLPDLSLLRPLRSLRSLVLRLGGTKQLAMLRDLPTLRYLELWMIRGLTDVSAIAELPELRYLFLQDLKNVTSLPSLGPLSNLRRVHLENLKGLRDLTPVAAAPRLEELLLINMTHLKIEDLGCLRGHPTLGAATIGLGSVRRNAQAVELLGCAEISESKPVQAYVES